MLKRICGGGGCELGLMTQVDYCFNDLELKEIFAIFNRMNVANIILFSPSLYYVNKNPVKFLEFLHQYIYSFLTKKRMRYAIKMNKKQQYDKGFRRNIEYLINISSEFYSCTSRSDYAYPSGRISMLQFVIKG